MSRNFFYRAAVEAHPAARAATRGEDKPVPESGRRLQTGCQRIPLALLVVTVALFLPAPGLRAEAPQIEYRVTSVRVAGAELPATVPSGYEIELLSRSLRAPRLLTFGPGGDLFVGSRSGNIYRLTAPYREADVLVKLKGYPHGVAFRDGEILIARTDGLYRAPWDPGQRSLDAQNVTLLAALPGGWGHSSRTARVGPHGRVYASLGIRGNCSDEYLGADYPFERRRGGVLVLEEGEGQPRWVAYASGLRNPVGFDWHPETGEMFASNNGPDHLGFELPLEYFSRIEAGSFHGMPWYQFDGNRLLRDPCAEDEPPASEPVPPAATFPARSAPMAVAFVGSRALDDRFFGDAVVALHGSWATSPSGGHAGDPSTRRHPKLVLVRFEQGKPRGVDDLVTGFQLPDGRRWARPVGVAFGPDGALYFTSDEGVNGLFRMRRVP